MVGGLADPRRPFFTRNRVASEEKSSIPSNGEMCPMVINKSQPIESIGSRLRDHTRTFDSGVRARSNSRRTPPLEGIKFGSLN